jgi:hypothetical protein
MDSLTVYEIIAIVGTVITGFFGFLLKIWRDHSKLTNRVIDVVEKNAISNKQLSGTIVDLEKSVVENTQITRATRESFTELLVALIKRR